VPPRRSRLRSLLGRIRPRRLIATWRWWLGILADTRRRAHDPRLSVAVDANPLWEGLTGVGWSLHLVLSELASRRDLAIRLYGPALFAFEEPEVEEPLPTGPAIEMVRYPVPEDLSLPPHYLEKVLKLLVVFLIRRDRNDVVHAGNFFLPRRLQVALGGRVPSTVVVHDLAMRHHAWTLAEETKSLLDQNLEISLRQAGRILTPSQTVRDELLTTGLATAERVEAVPHGPGHLALVGAKNEGVLPTDQRGDFALHVGTFEPRKNLALLVEAWQRARARSPRVPKLVLCGASGWKNDQLRPRLEAGVEQGWLELPGYVSRQELWQFYRRASFLVCPSLYEGFGLPLVEAMSAGTPLLVNDIAVFREVAADAAEFVDASDPAALAEAIVALAGDSSRRCELSRAALRRLDSFSWPRAAERTLAAWRSVGSERHARRVPGSISELDQEAS
jgi:alpha-1,3-rhamnosyl/mannosyltransferase